MANMLLFGYIQCLQTADKYVKRGEEKSTSDQILTENSRWLRGMEGSRQKMVSEQHG